MLMITVVNKIVQLRLKFGNRNRPAVAATG